jgi:hypothetical protein
MRQTFSGAARIQAFAVIGALATASFPAPAAAARQGQAVQAGDVVTGRVHATSVIAGRAASIVGSAWRADNTPIPEAHLRLRNVITGEIETTTIADEEGQFAFADVPNGAYVVELVSDNGKILTIGHPFTVSGGETVATFVRLGTKVPWFNGFFGNAALAVATAAASTGLTALAPEEVDPVSGRQ